MDTVPARSPRDVAMPGIGKFFIGMKSKELLALMKVRPNVSRSLRTFLSRAELNIFIALPTRGVELIIFTALPTRGEKGRGILNSSKHPLPSLVSQNKTAAFEPRSSEEISLQLGSEQMIQSSQKIFDFRSGLFSLLQCWLGTRE